MKSLSRAQNDRKKLSRTEHGVKALMAEQLAAAVMALVHQAQIARPPAALRLLCAASLDAKVPRHVNEVLSAHNVVVEAQEQCCKVGGCGGGRGAQWAGWAGGQAGRVALGNCLRRLPTGKAAVPGLAHPRLPASRTQCSPAGTLRAMVMSTSRSRPATIW